MSRFARRLLGWKASVAKVFIAEYSKKFRPGREEDQRGLAGGVEVPPSQVP
jgi:hypothetical protein